MAKSSTPYTRNREKYDSMVDPAGNLPPQAVELEEAVLGALMLEKDSVIEIQDILSATRGFSRSCCRAIGGVTTRAI